MTVTRKKQEKGSWFRRLNFGTQLTIQLLPLVLIPALIMGIATYRRAYNLLREQSVSQMTVATVEQVAYLDSWAKSRQDWLFLRTGPGTFRDAVTAALRDPQDNTAYQVLQSQIEEALRGRGTVLFNEIIVARVENGTVTEILASSQPLRRNTSPQVLSTIPMDSVNIVSVHNDPDFAPSSVAVFTVAPMRALSGDTIDIAVIGVNSGASLVSMMEQIQVFWQRKGVYQIQSGRAYLVKQPDTAYLLPQYATQVEVQTGISLPALNRNNTEDIETLEYTSLEGERVLGSFQWLPVWNAALVIELPVETAFGGLNTLTPFMAALLVITTVVVSVVIPLFTSLALRPLQELTRSVDRMAAGDLQQRVSLQRSDELGRLAAAFNQMASELFAFYQSLEARVRERTRQIHTAAAIARDATADRPIEELMDETVWLISDRFHYYHAAIFLLDQNGEFAVLKTASSEAGQKMMQRGYRLPVGKIGLVGYVTATGEPSIAPDVSENSTHFPNPDLPDTRSEIAIPLRRGKKILGALDVQSKDLNAFSEEDILVLETMADQLAVAIENTQLIQQQTELAELRRQILEVYQNLSREQTFEELTHSIPRTVQETLGYRRVTLALNQFDELVLKSSYPEPEAGSPDLFGKSPAILGFLDQCLRSRTPIFLSPENLKEYLTEISPSENLPSLLSFPLQTGGRILGVLAVERSQPAPPTEEEGDIYELLAGQIAASLQNALLIEETQQSLEQVQTLYRQQTREAWTELLESRTQAPNMASYESQPDRAIHENENLLNSPLQLRGETIGSLMLSQSQNQNWSSDDLELIESIADEVASAVEQQRLLVEIHRRAAELQIAAEIARDATGLLDPKTLMQRAVQLIRQRFGFYHAGIYLKDTDTDQMSLRASSSDTREQLAPESVRVIPGTQTILGQVAALGQTYISQDSQKDNLFEPVPGLPDTASQIVIPLQIGGRVFGALDVHSNHPHTFQESDIAVLEILADQISVAIENARTYQEAVQQGKREEVEVQFTRQVRAEPDLNRVIHGALSFLQTALGARSAALYMHQTALTDKPDTIQPEPPARLGEDV